MERETARIYLKEGNKLKRQGKLKKAIASYRKAIKINPHFSWSHHQLGATLAKRGLLDKAIMSFRRAIKLNPNSAWSRYELAEVFATKGELDEAIANYRRACELEPDFGGFSRGLEIALGKLRENNLKKVAEYRAYAAQQKSLGNLDEAISGYRKAIEIKPQAGDYYKLALLLVQTNQQWDEALFCHEKLLEIKPKDASDIKLGTNLVQEGKLQQVIDSYHNVFQKKIEYLLSYWRISAHLANVGLLKEGIRFFEEFPKPKLPKQEKKQSLKAAGDICKYDLIWDWFNCSDSQEFNLDIDLDCLQLETNEINQHFQKKQASVFVLPCLTEKEQILLEELGISPEYVSLMRLEENGVENIYLNVFESQTSSNNSESIQRNVLYPHKRFGCWHRINNPVEFPHTIAEFGYMYCLDPMSGKTVRTNESFFLGTSTVYRFRGREVFYIIAGGWSGDKLSIYIPKIELVIYHKDWDLLATKNVKIFQDFQSFIVTHFKDVLRYLNSSNSRKVTSCLGFIDNLGHYFWQDLNGIYYCYKNQVLDKIDRFALGPYEKMELTSIMPEIPNSKILKVLNMSESEQFQFLLKNNCFCFRITEHFISSECMDRVRKASLDKCSPDLLSILTDIKQNRQPFPLLWINVRSHNKNWISQEKGYAEIINKLSDGFPNLGIVFDGWIDCNEVVENIQKQLKANIKVYNTLGCPVHESITWAYYIDAYIAVVGSGLTVTSWLNDKPGVAYANKGHIKQEMFWSKVKEQAIAPSFLKDEDIFDVGTGGWGNYELDWQVIYNKILPILEQIEKECH